ncbi:MAG: alpha-L-fucosidase [Armatimonadetes bacterium CG2_30_59_28]|nr:alpha-L-fucosidase [Armatimonadota bacterium]OIO91112.1 MAG: alpha-L-fucosidase [Armatimonadetes bacterium CG2_30_59_28]PIU61905.1 MAG: alpha-L-fucosidase [Armatimonadetes bacterium CG07_land_8_20_14_0_80_59_28]PIX40783.1 MAG: alpha-L-fucosidase [Armatimonadetes bacterium CG_4_8_14_3_um_filter_58_9]
MPTLPESTIGDTSWFIDERFGMFIHWGIYAAAARHEWVKHREKISDEDYQKYFDHFDPDLYDPRTWAREAKNAGMKYFVITTKHHDGFCLWDSALTDYKATNTPCGKDLLTPMVEAFRDEGLRVGFYHSLIDWHHPQFTIDGLHPMRENEEFREAQKHRDVTKYAEYLHGQTRELLTRFGKIDIIWFDFSYSQADYGWSKGKGKDDWQSEKLMAMLRDLQPGIIVNNRLEIPGDVHTPEQFQPRGWVEINGKPVVWEACQTFSGSWGYYRDEYTWKSTDMLVQMLIDGVAKGGNLLLNVGPNARGELDPRAIERLRGMGEWMRLHSRSIYGCTASDFVSPADCRYTQNGNRLYLHLFAWPFRNIHLDGLAGKVQYAQLLNDASEIHFAAIPAHQQVHNTTPGGVGADTLTLDLPISKPDVVVPVVEMFLKD